MIPRKANFTVEHVARLVPPVKAVVAEPALSCKRTPKTVGPVARLVLRAKAVVVVLAWI